MKIKIVLTLIVLVISFCAPLQLNIHLPSGSDSSLLKLDVCRTAGTFLSANAEVPVVIDQKYSLLISGDNTVHNPENHISLSFIPAFPQEHPPKS